MTKKLSALLLVCIIIFASCTSKTPNSSSASLADTSSPESQSSSMETATSTTSANAVVDPHQANSILPSGNLAATKKAIPFALNLQDGRAAAIFLPEGFSIKNLGQDIYLTAEKGSIFESYFGLMFKLSELPNSAFAGQISTDLSKAYIEKEGDTFYYINTSSAKVVFQQGDALKDDTYYQFGSYYVFTQPYNGVSYIGGLGTTFIDFDKNIFISFFHDSNLPESAKATFESIVSSLNIFS